MQVSIENIQLLLRKFFFFSLCGICFLLPFEPKFLATIEIVTILLFFLAHSPTFIFNNIRKRKEALPFFLFFAAVFISYFFSTDTIEAERQVKVKLPFFLISLLIWGSGLSKRNARIALITFISGCALACICLLVWAIYAYTQTQDSLVFTYTNFSRFMHVSYFGSYLLFCFAWLFMVAMEDKLLYPKTHIFLMLLFALCLVLISAKITLLAFGLSSFFFAGYYFYRKKKFVQASILLVFICAAPFVLYWASANVKQRVDNFKKEWNNRNKPIDYGNIGSTSTRLIIWKEASEELKQHGWLGVGVGDVQKTLNEKYEKLHLTKFIEKRFNMHNEYLQEWVGLGIFGLLLFIAILLMPAFVCASPYRFIGIIFSFNMTVVSLTESILERQAGTIFICLIGILLLVAYEKPNTRLSSQHI